MKPKKIDIIDYGMGNLQFVRNALERLGCEVQISSNPAALADADALILPGVGAFGKAQEAVELVRSKQYEFPYEYLNEFLEYHQLTEAEFRECEERWRNHDIWHKVNGPWRLKNEVC